MANKYQDEIKAKSTLKLRQLLIELPPFMHEFFRGIAENTSIRTRIGYAYDLRIFFNFLTQETTLFAGMAVSEFGMVDLARVTADEIEEFMEYVTYYVKDDDQEFQNEERSKSRKLAAVRTMFTYFYKKRKLTSNPSELVDFPKIHDKAVILLEIDEIAALLDEVESGAGLTDRQKKFHQYNMPRDLAIITLMLGTGIRVSECVGIDLEHIDFNVNGIKITRKGGDGSVVYFGEEVEEALKAYIDVRKKTIPEEQDTGALFLSLQKKRITDRAVQMLVKKYARKVTTLKNISPHKLRSTFGTQLYRETRDIYLVADVLGHADVNTTRRHYAQIDEDSRRRAASFVKLRK